MIDVIKLRILQGDPIVHNVRNAKLPKLFRGLPAIARGDAAGSTWPSATRGAPWILPIAWRGRSPGPRDGAGELEAPDTATRLMVAVGRCRGVPGAHRPDDRPLPAASPRRPLAVVRRIVGQ